MRRVIQGLLIVAMTGMFGCGGSSNHQPAGSPAVGVQYGNLVADGSPPQAASEFPTSLPMDTVQPWEELGANGMVVPGSQRGTSATGSASEFLAGTQTESVSGNTTNWNGALRMESGDSGAGELSHAIYRIPLGGSEPGVVSVDANLRPMSDGKLGGYYVGLADYGNNSWQWFGPVTDAQWRISAVQSAREAANFSSTLGSVFVCVVAHNGAAIDLVGVSIDALDPADSTPPDAPPTPTLTPVAGGLLVDWTAFAGSDIAGYKLYYKDSAFTELTAFSANTLSTLHDSLLRLSLDEHSPKAWWVAISTVDLSGNESAISAVASAMPLASTGSVDPVWIDLDNATALLNQPIAMTASGADSYDWDLDGDGEFDVLGDETGTQNIDTSSPGIIRPLLRGNSSGGSFIALSAVSVVVSSNARPVVQAFVDPAFGQAPLTVQFTSNQSDFDGVIVERLWDFKGDGSVSWRLSTAGGAENPGTYIFTTPGLYNAKVRVWDDDGAWDADNVTVQVLGYHQPVAIITSVLECQMGEDVTFDAQQSFALEGSIVQYEWDFAGGGLFDYDSTPDTFASATFSDPGYHEVRLRVTDSNGATSKTAITLTVHGWISPLAPDVDDDVGEHTSLLIVDGNPAISYFDATNLDLMYIRARDNTGYEWDVPQVAHSNGSVGAYSSLAYIDGNPAISFFDSGWKNLSFIRLY